MRILFLALDVDLGIPRGESVHVRELVSNWASLGHSVRLVTASSNPTVSAAEHHRRAASALSQILQSRRLAGNWADIIYERRPSPKVSWAASKLTGIPFVVEINGVVQEETGPERARQVRGMPMRLWFRRRMLRAASRIVAVSRGVRDDLVARYGLDSARVVVIPNGANTDLFRPLDPAASRDKLSLPRDARIVCFTGNLAPWQGVDRLIRACATLKPEVPSLHLLIVGDGEDRSRLRSLATQLGMADRTHFAGSVPYEEVPTYINCADVCAAPFQSGRKASPIKVFEYLACAKPVVVSNIDEIGEFLAATSAGLVVMPDDERGFAEAIKRILRDPEQARVWAQQGRQSVMRMASWKETARRVADVLQSASSGL